MKRRNKTLLTAGAAFAAVLMQSAAIGAERPADARIPIIGWVGLPQDKASAERYAEAKDAGFTHLTQWCKTPSDAGRLLAEAEKAGIKLIIGFGGRNITRMADEAEAFTAAAKDSPALEYYFIADEPHIEKAGDLRDCIARYEALDPAHPCYVNLLGAGWDPETRDDRRRTRGNTGCDTYGEYLESLYKTVPLKMLSFDVYPVCAAKPLGNADHRLHGARAILNDRWYETLETASAFARKKGVPMFAFALSTAHGHFPGNEYTAPTIRHFRLQMYSNLAYGAQALQYFRYWAGGIAPVLVDGKRSPVFELVREMNQELQARAFVFKGAKVRNVWHTGVTIPIGTKRLDPKALPPFVTSFTADKRATLAVSWLKNGNTDYLVVLNRDPNDDTDFAATFAPGVKLVRRDGTLAEAGSYADFFWLEPGDVAVFAAPGATSAAAAEMPQTLRFERVWEGRNVFDADIPFPDGVTFVPGAEYRGEVRSLPAAMRIVDASGAVLATFAAPTNVAPPYTMHLAITGIQSPAVFVTKDGKTSYFGRTKFQGEFDPRRSEYLRTLSVVPDGGMGAVSPRLSAGVGQADVRFVTHGREGRPYIEDGRMYFTFSARFFCSVTGVGSLDAAHPERGVRFEGVVLYDYGDGLLRNDLAPHLFYDDEAGEWRGWACNFSTGTAMLSGRAQGGVNAVWSRKSPLHGLSVMKAKSLGLTGMHEDPCGVWDASAKKWRMFICTAGKGGIRAQMLESDRWDGGYAETTGRVAEDSTGTTIAWLGARRYCLSGSSDRAYYVYSYPGLEKLGRLDMNPTPWGEAKGGPHGRGWPALAELPGGSPHRCILLTMDRVNFPGVQSPNWTYGGLQIYVADRNFAAPMLVPAPREMTVTGGGVPLATGGEPLAGHPWIGDGLPDRNGADWYDEDPAPEFRATFTLTEGTHDARLHFACAGFASLRAGDETLMAVDGLDTLWTPYDKTVYSKTFTVKPGAGPREIVVRLGNGFYNLPPLRFWGSKCFRTALAHGRPCFKLAMEIDGAEKPLEWKWRRTNVVRNSVYLGTEIDATRPEDAEWKPAAEVAGPRGTIRPWPEASMRSDGFHEGKAGWLKEGEVQVVDFGVNASGVPDFLFRGEARGTRIEIVYGERLNADGSVNVLTQTAGQVKRGNGGPGAPHVACQRDAYTCGGAAAERFSPPFTWHIFRYAEIRGAKRLLGAGDARRNVRSMVSLGEKAPAAKAFKTDDPRLAAIHEMCRRTFQANMIGGVQSDCPGRERLGYGGDIVSTCEAMMLNWDMRAIYLKVLQDFADEASDDGWITETAPYTGIGDRGFDKRGGPISWALAVPELIDGLLRHYNETRALDYYPVCARYIRLLAAKHPDGLVPKCIGDHEALQRAPDDMTATAHWHRFVSLTAGFAKRMGRADDAAEFGALADKIKAAFAAKYVKDGIVANGTQSAQAIALYLGLVPQNQVAAAERRLLESIEEKGYGPTTGIFSTRYMLMYLSEHGRRDVAEKIVLHKGFPGWLHMLDRGATTLWETWKESDNVFSNCHPMFGSVDEWILRFGK